MAAPVLTYSKVNGNRVVTVTGSKYFPSPNVAAPAGVHDIKTVNGQTLIKIGSDLYEPLDIAAMRGKI